MRGRGRRTKSPPRRPSSFEVGREEVGDAVRDRVVVAAVPAGEGPLDDLVRFLRCFEDEVPLAHGAAQDVEEVALHAARIARARLTFPEALSPALGFARRGRAPGLRGGRGGGARRLRPDVPRALGVPPGSGGEDRGRRGWGERELRVPLRARRRPRAHVSSRPPRPPRRGRPTTPPGPPAGGGGCKPGSPAGEPPPRGPRADTCPPSGTSRA